MTSVETVQFNSEVVDNSTETVQNEKKLEKNEKKKRQRSPSPSQSSSLSSKLDNKEEDSAYHKKFRIIIKTEKNKRQFGKYANKNFKE